MLEKLKQFIDGPSFLKYALLTTLVLSFTSLVVAILFAQKVYTLTKFVKVHDQVLVQFTTGKLPVIKLNEQGTGIPFAAFIYNQVNELTKQVKALTPAETKPEKPEETPKPKFQIGL